jgi:hypothetical protein
VTSERLLTETSGGLRVLAHGRDVLSVETRAEGWQIGPQQEPNPIGEVAGRPAIPSEAVASLFGVKSLGSRGT